MEHLNFSFLSRIAQESGWHSVISAVPAIFILLLSYRFLFSKREGEAITVNVPIPPQCKDEYWDDFDPLHTQNAAQGIDTNEDIIPCICPADGRVLDPSFKAQGRDWIDIAIQRTTEAQPRWAATTFAQRRQVLRTILRYVLDHQDDIVTACCLDSGKTRLDAYFGEILVTAEKLKWTIEHGEKSLQPSKRPTNFLMFYKDNEVRYEPLGVVSACVSWNYPFHNFISPIISAIFTGNAIVVKPSEQVAWSSVYFNNIVRCALSQCGHDPEIVQSVICLPKDADYLTSHPGISYITFIGSREIAHKVCASAAKSLTPVCVELGGKDPAIVLDDPRTVANLEDVASILMRGVFQNAGQNCIGIERVIALPGVYDELIKIVTARIENLKIGSVMLDEKRNSTAVDSLASQSPSTSHIDTILPSTTDLGALISSRPISRLESLIDSAVSDGAVLHHGGTSFSHPRYPSGTYFSPTLLSSVTPSMPIAQHELFAPVFLIMPATSLTHAISLANSTPYALGSSVFGYEPIAISRCLTEVKAGMISVNDFGAYYATSLPFGGVKGSGYGRFGGKEGLRGLCNMKSVCRDRWTGNGIWVQNKWISWQGISTKIPGLVDLPGPKLGSIQNPTTKTPQKPGTNSPPHLSVAGSLRAKEMIKGVIELGYGIEVSDRIRGMVRMISALSEEVEWVLGSVFGVWVLGDEQREREEDEDENEQIE